MSAVQTYRYEYVKTTYRYEYVFIYSFLYVCTSDIAEVCEHVSVSRQNQDSVSGHGSKRERERERENRRKREGEREKGRGRGRERERERGCEGERESARARARGGERWRATEREKVREKRRERRRERAKKRGGERERETERQTRTHTRVGKRDLRFRKESIVSFHISKSICTSLFIYVGLFSYMSASFDICVSYFSNAESSAEKKCLSCPYELPRNTPTYVSLFSHT